MRRVPSLAFLALLLAAPAAAKKIAPPNQFGPAQAGLRLGLEVDCDSAHAGDALAVVLVLENVGEHDLTVYGHVATDRDNFDWFSIDAVRAAPTLRRDRARLMKPDAKHKRSWHPLVKDCSATGVKGVARVLQFVTAREKSVPITVTLKPGEQLRQAVSLSDWARQPVNGGAALMPGWYKLRAHYVVEQERGVWSGAIASDVLAVKVPGQAPRDSCDDAPAWNAF